MGEFVRLEVEGAVGTIRLDRPKMNAINGRSPPSCAPRPRRRATATDVRAVVLYGGERVFAAGRRHQGDVAITYGDMLAWGGRLQESLKVVARLPKPVIAAVTGYALGGGFELALTADFRVLGERAKVGVPEITLGVIPGAGGTQRLTRLVGPGQAKDLVFSGRHVAAEEALALGIADRVVPDADVYDDRARDGRSYADGPAVALRAAKQAIDDGPRARPGERAAPGDRAVRRAVRTEDQRIGMTSFVENGPGKAQFTGR
jgi:enoyl-CoA hydratase/carnithine racemase